MPSLYAPVAARLLHRRYGLHPHKVKDDRYPTFCLDGTDASLVLVVFCELLRLEGERVLPPTRGKATGGVSVLC
jgi:hypothetical protein